MTLLEILAQPTGSRFTRLPVLIGSAQSRQTKDRKDYLQLSLCDKSGTTETPLWSDVLVTCERRLLCPGAVISVSGTISTFNGDPQLKISLVDLLPSDQVDMAALVPSYEIDQEDMDLLLQSIEDLREPWRGILKMALTLPDLDRDFTPLSFPTWTAFVTAPAAKSHHGNKLGGLFLHTSGVLKNVGAIIGLYPQLDAVIDQDRLLFLAIFHDIGKVYDYTWETGIAWRPETKVDHRFSGMTLFRQCCEALGNPLSYADQQIVLYSLLSHHGQFGEKQPESIEDWLLHLADMIDAKVVAATDAIPAVVTPEQGVLL